MPLGCASSQVSSRGAVVLHWKLSLAGAVLFAISLAGYPLLAVTGSSGPWREDSELTDGCSGLACLLAGRGPLLMALAPAVWVALLSEGKNIEARIGLPGTYRGPVVRAQLADGGAVRPGDWTLHPGEPPLPAATAT